MGWLPGRGRRGFLEVGIGVALASAVVTTIVLADARSARPGSSRGRTASPGEEAAAVGTEASSGPGRQLVGFDPARRPEPGGPGTVALDDDRRAVLTVDPVLEDHLRGELARYEVPWGAVVVLEPGTGRVRAWVSHSTANPGAGDLVRDPSPPAASVFKLITAAALVDVAGARPSDRVCGHGGHRRILPRHLEDDPARDRECPTLAEAMGGSVNVVFAKLADRHLVHATLARYAEAFGFGHALPFDAPTRASPISLPDKEASRLEFARTAAGFWHVHLSPFHAALVAATLANDGRMPRARMVDRVLDGDGDVLYEPSPEIFRAVVPRRTAQLVGRMMEQTCRPGGTADRAFFDRRGRPFLPGIRVAGKTGSLSTDRPYRGYSWWVGFAPADDPQLAVAALVVNRPRWRIKASYLAREALRVGLPRASSAAGESR